MEHKGITFTWEDICVGNNVGPGTTYEWPCLRISPMDLYQEARWYFEENDRVTWYDSPIRTSLIKPRLPRFGIMQGVCSSGGGSTSVSNACDLTLALRQDPNVAVANGFPPTYANPLALFSDIGGLELNHPCRICIEQGFESTMNTLTTTFTGVFGVMFQELSRYRRDGGLTDPAQLASLDALIQQVGAIASTMNRELVEEFYSYYVTRTLYAQLGAAAYARNFAGAMASLLQACLAVTGDPTLCPTTVTPQEAGLHLLNHADGTFSSVTTAGSPFPWWSNGNGTGTMFGGNSPVGGSGIFLGGQLLSSTVYMDLANIRNLTAWTPLYGQFMDPTAPLWTQLVESDPVYRWFIASVTPMTSRTSIKQPYWSSHDGELTHFDL